MAGKDGCNEREVLLKIVEVSCREFAEQGYSGVSLARVGEKAGVTSYYMTKTFKNREGLYLETAHEMVRKFTREFIDSPGICELLTTISEMIKREARIASHYYFFFRDYIASCSESPERENLLKTCFSHVAIEDMFERGIAMGLVVKGRPFDVFKLFLKAAFNLTECYIADAVELPSNEKYLHLVMNEEKEGLIKPLGWSGISSEERNAIERDYVVARLAGNYDGIAYVTVHTDDKLKDNAKVYRYNQDYLRIIPDWGETMGFSDRLDRMAEYVVHPEDRERFLRETKRSLILDVLGGSSAYVINFRTLIGGETFHYEMKFIPDKGPDKTVLGLIVGIHNTDAEVSLEKNREAEKERSFNIIRALCTEYASVYYYNPDDDVVVPLNMSERINGLMGEKIRGARLDTAVQAYIERGVIAEHKEEMRHALSLRVILNNIEGGKIYRKTFINNEGNYCEMKIVGSGESDNSFVMGFSVQDELIRNEILKESVVDDILRTFHDKDSDIGINGILKLTRGYYAADRIHLFTLSRDRMVMEPTYMAVSDCADPLRTARPHISYERAQRWCENISAMSPRFIDVAGGDVWFSEEIKRYLELNNIESVIITPVAMDGEVEAIVIIDNPKRNSNEFLLLRLTGALCYNRLLLKHQSEEGQRTLGKLVEAFESVQYVDFSEDYLHTFSANAMYNEEFGEISSYKHTIKRYIDKYVAPKDKERALKETDPHNIQEAFKTRGTISVKIKDVVGERERNFELRFLKANADGSAAVVCGIDNTELIYHEKLVQERLTRAIEEANAASLAKSEFLSRMSHDIRTPLNGVIGMTEIARMNTADRAKIEECLDKIDIASNHLLSLVNDVLDMSRIESGKTTIASEPFNMERFAETCFDIVSNQTLSKDLILEKQFGKFRHPNVLGDELHLKQIVINILGNAIKFTPAGGKVIFRIKEARRGFRRASYVIEVEDNGIGMSKEFIKHIWEPFLQEAGSARTSYKGTGLGMAITKHLVELMGGNISVESELNVGSLFRVEVSFAIDQSAAEEKQDNRPIAIKGCRVLLVEDNEINADVVREILVSQGALIDVAFDGEKGVEAFEKSGEGFYDIILMDIMMPVKDGLEATRIIRNLDRKDSKMIPIIAMTANAFDEDISKAMAAGMDAHLSKPVDVKTMLHTISDFYEVEL